MSARQGTKIPAYQSDHALEDPASVVTEAILQVETELEADGGIKPTSLIGNVKLVENPIFLQEDEAFASLNPRDQMNFNLLDSMMSSADLLVTLAAQTPTYDFINLIRTCKKFYHLTNQVLMGLVLECARVRAPLAVQIFSYRFYLDLCLPEIAHHLDDEPRKVKRWVPGFRFLKFLEWRESVVREIVRLLAQHGHRLPIGVRGPMLKFWFLMDIPDNARRVGIIRSKEVWSDRDLFFVTFFLVKLDLRLQHPENGKKGHVLRSLILAQRGLWYLRDVLARNRLLNETDLHIEYLRTYERDPIMESSWTSELPEGQRIRSTFGIPAWRMGADSREYFNAENGPLIPVDKLIVKESSRRILGFERYIESMILWGYIDEEGKDTDVILEDDEDEESDWIRKLSIGVGDQIEPLELEPMSLQEEKLMNRESSRSEKKVLRAMERFYRRLRRRQNAAQSTGQTHQESIG